MKKVAIIGANEFQVDLIKKSKDLGYETHVFSWGGGEPGEDLADNFYKISITEKEMILAKCIELNVDAVCSIASDLANITVHWVARKLNLPSHSMTCIKFTTDKFSMREQLALHNLPIPSYRLVESIEDINTSNLCFPLIVKPIDRSGSRGITKVFKFDELKSAILHSQEVSFTNKVLIEEFVEGREFSIESISNNGLHKILQVTEKFTTGSPKYIETAHLAPARLTDTLYNDIERIVSQALSALEIKFGPSHTEIKVNKNGEVFIIEIGSRMGGDFIGSYLVKSSTNVDFVALTIFQSLGLHVDLELLQTHKSKKFSSLVYYQVTNKNLNISNLPGVQVVDFQTNKDFSENVSCSNERYSYAKLLVRNDEVNNITKLIEKDYDSI